MMSSTNTTINHVYTAKKSNEKLNKDILTGSLLGAFFFTLLAVLMFCLHRRRRRFNLAHILPHTRNSDLDLTTKSSKKMNTSPSQQQLDILEEKVSQNPLPTAQLDSLPIARSSTFHGTSAQACIRPKPSTDLNERQSSSQSSLVTFPNPCVCDLDPSCIPAASLWPTVGRSDTTNLPNFTREQKLPAESVSRASNGSEKAQSSEAHSLLPPQRPRPTSCAPDFGSPFQSDCSNLPISKKTFPSRCESTLDTSLTSVPTGPDFLNVGQNSTRSSVVWSNETDNGNLTSHRRINTRARVHYLNLRRKQRRGFMSLGTLDVLPKVKGDRNLTNSIRRRGKMSDPAILQSSAREFQSVSMSSTFKSNVSNSEVNGRDEHGSDLHTLSNPVTTLLTTSSDPLLLIRSASGAQDILSPFDYWLNGNQIHRDSTNTINSLTGERRSSLRLISTSTVDSFLSTRDQAVGRRATESSFDTTRVVIGHN